MFEFQFLHLPFCNIRFYVLLLDTKPVNRHGNAMYYSDTLDVVSSIYTCKDDEQSILLITAPE